MRAVVFPTVDRSPKTNDPGAVAAASAKVPIVVLPMPAAVVTTPMAVLDTPLAVA